MVLKFPKRPPLLPTFLQQLHTDEYPPVPYTPRISRVVEKMRAEGPELASRLSLSLGDYWFSRRGTAAGLRALDEAWGGGFYNVPPEALLDEGAAEEALGGGQLVVDCQTHYISDRPGCEGWPRNVVKLCEGIAPDKWKGLNNIVVKQSSLGYGLAEYLRCVYLECETTVAILTSSPGIEGVDSARMVYNSEMMATRELIDRLGGSGRFYNHCVVHPQIDGELDMMDRWKEWCNPGGWKIYTKHGAAGQMYGLHGVAPAPEWGKKDWALDDDEVGRPFLERVRDSGVRLLCAHKGLSTGALLGWESPSSPRDIGPAAKAFPEITFIVFHSGYERRVGDEEEGPYSEEVSEIGTNRLIKSLKEAGIGPGGNVYAELGSTWFLMMSYPREVAHVMGKLLKQLGEDNIVWGTDSTFYGPAQPLIDGFRAFTIPEEYCERYGYPQLTPTAKEKILGLNAARIYGIDPEKTKAQARNDDLSWVREALKEYAAKGTPNKV